MKINERVILEAQNLTKTFENVIAVNNVSFKIKEGEFVSLLGPSGCGKTTLLRMIAGLEKPTSGMIYLKGNLLNNVKAYKRPINMVFQSYALFPHLNVFDNIAFGPRIKGMRKEEIEKRVNEMLKLVKLQGFENREINKLSGGQAQRVALARALINEPEVLLLDEPLGALDLKLRKEMQIELRNIQKKLGRTFIYVTHDQEEALVLSDRIMVMNEGKIIESGNPIEIYTNPKTVFSSMFIGETNLLDGYVEEKNKESDEMIVRVGDLKVKTRFRDDVDINDKIHISVRLENVILSRELDNRFDNFYEGIIENFIFLGPIVKYSVRVTGYDKNINSYLNVSDSRDYYRVGEKLYINWNKDNCNIIK